MTASVMAKTQTRNIQ